MKRGVGLMVRSRRGGGVRVVSQQVGSLRDVRRTPTLKRPSFRAGELI